MPYKRTADDSNTCVYCRGELSAAELKSLAEAHCAAGATVIVDLPPDFSGFRRLQDLVKLGLCKRVIMPSAASLGDDRWTAAENELFFKRNGVKLKLLQSERHDCRYDIANAIKSYFSPLHTWTSCHGEEPPLKMPQARKSMLYGYIRINGRCAVDEGAAEIVRRLFDEYAAGAEPAALQRRLIADTGGRVKDIHAILGNVRYLGSSSPGGRGFPGVVSPAQWFAARERSAERSRGRSAPPIAPKPYFACVTVKTPAGFYRSGQPVRAEGMPNINSDVLERKVEGLISRLAFDSAEGFYNDYVLPNMREAQSALSKAESALAETERKYDTLRGELILGARSEELQNTLARCREERRAAAVLARRIRTELELFSVTREQTELFFQRAVGIERRSRQEKRLIARAFVKSVRIEGESVRVCCRQPLTGRLEWMDIGLCE